MRCFILLSMVLNFGYSIVLFRNPSGLSKISAGLNEFIRIAWTVEPRDTTYLRSHLIFRKGVESCIIMSFDQEKTVNFSNIFQTEISSMGPTFVTLNLKSNVLEGALISIENIYKDSSAVLKVEVYDFLPIYIVHPPEIACKDVKISFDSLVSFECNIISKPEAFINIGFQKIPIKYELEKQLVEHTTSYYNVMIHVSFKMSALYLGKKIYVSASTGTFDQLKELIIPAETFPFNVQLYFDEQTTPVISLKPYTNSINNIYLRCSASSHDKNITYTIHGPNNLNYYGEAFTIDKLNEIKHVGLWFCTAKNNHGQVQSTNIRVSLQKGVPERPQVSIETIKSKDNVFKVNSKKPFTVICSSGSFPEVKMYLLQMINSGTQENNIYSKTGKFVLNYDQHFSENIYTCRAENLLGRSLPVVFDIQDTHNTGWSKTKSPFLQSSFITAICILSVFLLVMVLYIAVKLKRSQDARHLLWQIVRCRLCMTKFSLMRSQRMSNIVRDPTENEPLYDSNEQYSTTKNLFSDIKLQKRYTPSLELSADEEDFYARTG